MGILSSLFGIGGTGKPATTTQVIQSQIPEELSPFVKQILAESKALYEADIERGYDPYRALTTAPFTAEQLQAQEDIKGLRGTQEPFIQEALGIQREGAEKFTPEVAKEYMSPYQRAVTDIEKREAQTAFERTARPAFEKRAVDAGGMSGLGTRAGVESAEMQRGQSRLLADIEAKGLQSSFLNAQQQFAQQKQREQTMAANIGRTAPALFGATLAEAGAAEGVGAERRELAQSGLDEAYFKFLEEQQFPQRTLSQYSGSVYANPMLGTPSQTKTTTGTPYQPSMGQNLLGMGLAGLNIYGMGGGFKPGGQFSTQTALNKVFGKSGGTIGGLSGNAFQNYMGNPKAGYPQLRGGGSVGMSDKNLGKYMREGSGAISAGDRNRLMRMYQSGLSGLPVVRRREGEQVLDISGERYIPATDLDERSSPHPLPVDQQSMWPRADISLEEFQKFYPSLDPNRVRKVLQDQATSMSEERTRQATERKALTDPLIQSLEKGRGAGSAARKSGAIFTGIANMMKNPSGALVGLITSGGEVLSEIGKITREDAKFEADLAVKIFGIRKADLTEEHKAALQTIIEDGNIQKTLLELPGKARAAFLDELVKTATIAEKRSKLHKGVGELKGPLAKKITEMVGQGTGISATLNEEGNLVTLDGKTLKKGDAQKLGRLQAKFMEVFAKHRKKKGITDIEAAAITYKEIWGKDFVETKVEVEAEVNPESNQIGSTDIPTFNPNARKKSQ
jgi:hypothetical protein